MALKQIYLYKQGTTSWIAYEATYDHYDYTVKPPAYIKSIGQPINNEYGEYVLEVKEFHNSNVAVLCLKAPDNNLVGTRLHIHYKEFNYAINNDNFFSNNGILAIKGNYRIYSGVLRNTQ